MKTIELNKQIKNNVMMERKRSIIYMNKTDFPYIEVTEVVPADILNSSREKTIKGTFSASNVTSIKARNHYPHSIGSAWTFADPYMFSYENTAMVTTPVNGEFSNGNNIKIGKNSAGEDVEVMNASVTKEHTFWSADDGIHLTSENKEAPYAMRYNTIEPFAPSIDDPDYYSDKIEAYEASGDIPFTTPSGWYDATINQDDKTFEIPIFMNPFWHFQDTDYWQTYLDWRKTTSADIHKMQYDARLQAIELEIHCTYQGEEIIGTRWVYIWHCPQSWAFPKVHKIEKNDGTYSDPSSGSTVCGGMFPGCCYIDGFTASGGDVSVYCGDSGEIVNFDNILVASDKTPDCDTISLEVDIFDISQIKNCWIAYPVNGASFDPDDETSYEFKDIVSLASISLDGSFITSQEFLTEREGDYYIYFLLDYSGYLPGLNTSLKTYITPTGIYCGEGDIGSIRNYQWCVLCPSCSEICFGGSTSYCQTGLDLPESGYSESGIYSAACDDFDTGSGLGQVTTLLRYAGVKTKVDNIASDGHYEFNIRAEFQPVPLLFQNYFDAIALPLVGYAASANITNQEIIIINDIILDGEHSGIIPSAAYAERVLL